MCFREINPIDENLHLIPKVLYKYREFDSQAFGVTMATKGEVYFASAQDLNDPFEGFFIPESRLLKYEGAEFVNFVKRKALTHFPKATNRDIQILIQKAIQQKKYLQDADPRGMEGILNVQYKGYGILSLTPIPDSIPMWAYYSNKHAGFCVGMATSVIGEHQKQLAFQSEVFTLRKVGYKKKMPTVNVEIPESGMTDRQLVDMESTIYTKSKSWKHENEYRLLFSKHPRTKYSLGKEAIVEIIFGLNSNQKNRNELIKKVRAENPSIIIKQAVKSMTAYKIKLVTLE